LVGLAKAIGGRVVTNDFNLNKIAQLQGVDVINLNELANALKLVALPGEHLTIRIVKQGDQMARASAIWTTAPWWWWSKAAPRLDRK